MPYRETHDQQFGLSDDLVGHTGPVEYHVLQFGRFCLVFAGKNEQRYCSEFVIMLHEGNTGAKMSDIK